MLQAAAYWGVVFLRRWLFGAAVAVLLLTSPLSVPASPGGLDSRGGHHCWTNCARYGLYTGQYHCHRSPCGTSDIAYHRAHGH